MDRLPLPSSGREWHHFWSEFVQFLFELDHRDDSDVVLTGYSHQYGDGHNIQLHRPSIHVDHGKYFMILVDILDDARILKDVSGLDSPNVHTLVAWSQWMASRHPEYRLDVYVRGYRKRSYELVPSGVSILP